ncbi:ATP-dependent DNA helicase Rep [Cupriavidus laharis]|uniref:ATP-dependent DNA helicase Rep n=1 Tax=Cupriavidus laharis TaxID=151654 RepID=A0ABM8XJI2_9BURK|nr:3'-5' exonuclease [Cupriavidus laharis]CAG9180347.1 ATP-dependent DNA helicase Rep [Cupriavidus laharis]
MRPTQEQTEAVGAVAAGGPLKVKAYAGAGKTTFLRMASEARPRARGLYLAFNKDIAQEAQRKFPANTRCRTVHSLAFGSTSQEITRKLNYPVEPAHSMAMRYGLGPLKLPTTIGKTVELTTGKLGRMVMDGVARFCSSAQAEPQAWHIPVDPLIDEELAEALREELLPHVQTLWRESIDPRGVAAVSHATYVKLWQLSRPRIPADFILFDEAQDADGLMLSVLRGQSSQVVYVGDPYQQIYEWRGAVNAMDHIRAPMKGLTESFRFGNAIAKLASRMLCLMDEDVPVRGQAALPSRVIRHAAPGEIRPNAILCRKNTTLLATVAEGLQRGDRVAARTKKEELVAFIDGAERLRAGQRTHYPAALSLFENWRDVQEYAESFAGRDLQPLVKLIDEQGPAYLRQLLAAIAPEEQADYVVSTVHRAKGLEWPTVTLADDFRFRREDDGRETLAADEKRLLYVALTRAQHTLDISRIDHSLQAVFRDASV